MAGHLAESLVKKAIISYVYGTLIISDRSGFTNKKGESDSLIDRIFTSVLN